LANLEKLREMFPGPESEVIIEDVFNQRSKNLQETIKMIKSMGIPQVTA
jgi:hypothetical protein